MRSFDPAAKWFIGYFLAFLILLKVTPVTVGSLTLALLFVLIIENLSDMMGKLVRMRRGFRVLLASLIFYGILSYSIYRIFPIVMEEGNKVLEFMKGVTAKSSEELFPNVKNPEHLRILRDIMDWAGKQFYGIAGEIGKYVVSKVPALITSVTLLVIASAYITAILPKIKGVVHFLFPRSTIKETRTFIKDLYADMKKFVGGQMVNAAIVGLIVWFGMLILRMKYSGFLGLLAGVTDFIPFLGVIITAVPAFFIGASQHGIWGLIGAAVVLTIANQVEGWILAPKILGDRVKLNWFVVLITMLGLSEIYGFIGVLISVPFLIMVRGIWRHFFASYLMKT